MCPYLIPGCYRLDDPCLVALLNRCSHLHTLDLSLNSRLGESAVASIATALPLLTHLKLTGCAQLRDNDLKPFYGPLRQLSNLRKLLLCGLSELTDASVAPLLEALGGGLTHLSLRGTVQYNEIGYTS